MSRRSPTLAWFRTHLRRSVSALLLSLYGIWSGQTQGATYVWDGGANTWDNGTTAWWNTGNFWSNSNNNIAIFGSAPGIVTLGAPITAGGLVFNSSGYSIVPTTSETLTLTPLTGTTSPVIAVNNNGFGTNVATIAAQVAGTNGFTKTGNGTLRLSADNSTTLSGDISIKQGQLVITNANQLGALTGTAISVTGVAQTGNPGYSGGTLMLQGSSTSASATGITLQREVTISGRGPGAVNNTGGLVSIGYNTLQGGFTLGAAGTVENRAWATHGVTTISGGLDIGATGVGNILQGNGNWFVSGVVTASENSSDRFIKTGQLITTTLWLQNAANNFTDALRVDSGTVRVQSNGALGSNVGTGQIDLNNGTLEIRSDLAAGFAGRNARVRNNTTGTFFVDHDLTGGLGISTSLQNQTVTMGSLIRDSGGNVANFTFNGRNGYNITFTSATPGAADFRGITVTNNSSGTVTLTGGNVWNANNATASTYTVQGNGDTVITGSVVTSAVANVLTKGGTGTFFYGGTAGSYQGATNISAGSLSFSDVGGFAGTSQINIGNATTTAGTLTYTGGAATLSKNILLNSTTAPVYINASGTGALVLNGSILSTVNGAKTIVLGGTSAAANEIQSVIGDSTSATNLQKIGAGTWILSGANTFNTVGTGATGVTVSGGTLAVQDTFSGGSRNVIVNTAPIVFNVDSFSQAAGGTFQYLGAAGSASAETVGALTGTTGQGIVEVIVGAGAPSATLTFASLGTRAAGASVNVKSSGTVNITGTSGFVNGGVFFGGADFAYSDVGTTLRAPVYGTDAGFVTSGASLTAASHNEITGNIASGALAINSLRINGGNTLTLSGALTVGVAAGSGIIQTGGSGIITGGNVATSAAGNDLQVRVDGGTNSLTINSPITTSTAGLTKSGDGTLILGGANTYSGTVNVNEGKLQMATGGLLGATNIGLTVRQGATFDLNGINVGTIASGTNSVNALNGAGTITNSGALATLRVGNNNGSGYFTGDITGGANMSLVKNGSGTLSLTNNNSNFGTLTISAGTVAFALPGGTTTWNAGANSPVGTGSTAAGLVFNGGTLQYTGATATIFQSTQTPSISTDREFTLAGNGTIDSSGSFGNGVLAHAANSASIVFTSTADITITGTGTRTLTLQGDSVGDNEMRIRLKDNPNAAEALSLTKGGGGLWILNPGTSNDYTGTTTISGGALRVASSAAAVQGLSASSPLVINGGVLETSGSFTRTLGAAVVGVGTTVAITGGASGFAAATPDRLVVSIGGGGLTWGNTNFNPTSLVLGSSTALGETEITNDIAIGTATRTITVNNNGNTGTMVTAGILSGVISGAGTGGNALIKNGGGVLILGNANTYTGSTRIDNGNIVVTSIGTGTSSSLGASGALIYNGPGNGDLNGLLYVGSGETANRDLTFQGSNFTGNRTYRIDASGSGALVWNTGTFVNTTRGDTVARVVTLELRGASVDNNQLNLVLTNSTNGTFPNQLAISKNDGGVWILNPASPNTFNSTITVGGGLLGLTANGIGSASNITLSNGGIFAYGAALSTSTPIVHNNNTTAVFAGQNSMTFNGTYTVNSGANDQTISNNLENGALLTINGNFVNSKANNQTINVRGFGSTEWNGVITDAAANPTSWNIAIANDATFTFGGASANTYTGVTTLSQGTLILNKTLGLAQIGSGTSQFNFGGGVLQSNAGALIGANKLNNSVFLTGDPVTVAGINSIEFSGVTTNNAANRNLLNNLTGGATLTLSGTVNLSNDATGRTLTVRGSGNTTISGVVANGGTGAGGLAFSGSSGSLTLTNTNTATGALTVNRNTTTLSGSGSWAGSVALNPTATLTLDNSGGTVNRLADAGAVTGAGGILNFIGDSAGSSETTGALTLNSVQSYITANAPSGGANSLTFASVAFPNTGSALNLGGVPNLGSAGTGGNQIFFTTAPTDPAIITNNVMPRIYIGGNDFATYGGSGVVAFSGYNPTSTTDINAALSQDTVELNAGMTTFTISDHKTINAIKINGSGLSVAGAGASLLTLSSGGIINTGGNNSLDVAGIVSQKTSGTTGATGQNVLTPTGGTVGYGVGQAVTGTGVPAGTYITAVTPMTITLSNNLTGANPSITAGPTVTQIQVQSGTTLTVNSAFIGPGALAKSLTGTLNFATRQFYTSTTNLLNGTTKLSGGVNTLFPNQILNINDGATLDLVGSAQYVGQLSDPGTMPGAGGTITTSTGTGTFVTNLTGSALFSGEITGNVNLGRLNGNTLTINSLQDYTGGTYLLGGTTTLESEGALTMTSGIEVNAATLSLSNNSGLQYQNNDRIGDAIPINLRDGTLSITGRVSTLATEALGAVTSAQGANTITASTGGGTITSMDLTLASLTRSPGTTVNFTGTNLGQQGNSSRIIVQTPLTTVLNGALGAWAIANTNDYAAYNTGNGIGVVGQGGYAGYSGAFGSGLITEVPASATTTTTLPAGTTTTGLLKIAGAFTNDIAFTNGTDTLNLEQGGILRSNNNNASTIGTASVRGVITSGTSELVVFNNQNTLTINSVIQGATRLIKSGGGTLSLTANNTYSLGTTVDQGTVTLNGTGVVIPAGGVLLGGATMTMVTNAGQIDPTNVITLRRSSTLTLVGNNTLDSLVFENNGGTTNPTVNVGGILTLSNSTPVDVSLNQNALTVPTITGGTLALGSGAKTINVTAPSLDGSTLYSAMNPALSIASAITGSGPITKTGNGLLQLSGASSFYGLNVNAGGIVIGASSTTSAGTVISGPLGTGPVAMASGTTIFSNSSSSVGNPISFAGTPMFDSTANTVWTNTFTGTLSGAGVTGPSITVNVANPFQTVALLGTFPGTFSSITKTGLGTLVFNATSYTGNFNATALGNPYAVSLIHDGDGTGSVQTIAMGSVTFDTGIVPNITVNRGGSLPFGLASNKILAPSSISNTGLGITVTNSAGYGLKVSDATAFTGTPTISVSSATASNVTQGLYLTGDLSGTGFNKIGAGTVVLSNATPANNTFTGTININQGVVSVNDDAQLGNAANVIQLNPTTGTSTLRATGTFATSRTIDLTTASNTRSIEVTDGNTLTLNSAFGLTAASAALVKGDLGTLVLGAANTGWTGNLTINAGVVSPTAANTLPSGTIIVNENSAALQLSGGITLTNALTIDALANGRTINGLNTGGAFQSVSGSNTIGTVTVNAAPNADNQSRNFGFGADNGATLNIGAINMNHASGGTNRNVIGYFNTPGTGVINLTGVLDNTNASPGSTFLFKVGDGTMNLTAANAIPDTEVRLYRGGMTLGGAATFGTGSTQVQVWQSGTLTLNNGTNNTASRFSNRVVQIGGGTLNFIPNASGTTHTSTGALQVSQGSSTINLAAGGNQAVTFASLTQNGGATVDLTGTFGTATNFLKFTSAPTLSPASTGLLARWTVNGSDFATYSASTGVGAFTGYAVTTNVLSATATSTFKATPATLNSLTSNQTLNALVLDSVNSTASIGGLGGNPPAALTLTSGGILAKSSGSGTVSNLNVPIVAFAGVEGVIHVQAGQTLNVMSGMSGTAGLTKGLTGTLNLNQQQFVSGNTIVNGGTLNLQSGATNTLLFNNGLGINNGATVDMKNGVQFIGSLFSANAGGNTDLTGGTITNSGAQATLVTNSNSNFNGQITGTIFLNKTGVNPLNLQQPNTYSGPTLITGGTLTLQDDGTILNSPSFTINYGTLSASNTALRDNANRINDAATITMNGGTLNFQGRAQANSSETVGAVTIVEGHNNIFANDADVGIGSGVLTIASLTRAGSTATLRFNNAGDFGLIGTRGRVIITAAPTLNNSLIGAWAVVDREFASYDSTYGVGTLNQAGFAGYSANSIYAATSTDNIRFAVSGTTTLAANTTVGTLTFGQQGAATTLDLGGNTLTIAGGGLIFGQGTDNVNFGITNGSLTGPVGGGDLYIHHLNYSGTNRTASIDAAITNNGTDPVRVIKNSGDTGASVMTWNGTNTFTGGLEIQQGTLTLGATGTLNGGGGIKVLQGTLIQTAGGVIPAQTLTLGGGSTVTLANQANTLTGLVINNLGGGAPTLTPTGTLTLTGGITVSTINAGNVATIGTGTLDLNGAGSYSMSVGATVVNGVDVAPWQAGLIINSVIQNGGITKSGAGLLQLSGQSTFAGGLNVTGGGLVLAGSSTPNGLLDTVISGPLGTGDVTMAANTTMVATTAAIVSNNFTFLGDTVFNGINNITLNGITTLPTTWNATVTAPQMTVTIGDASPSLSTDVINKAGLGTLSVGNYAGTINIAGGLILTGDGNTLGSPESLNLGSALNITSDTAITVKNSGSAPNARNKTLQESTLTDNGSIVAINNVNGYGLQITGATTFSAASHISVANATASNLVPGVTLSGVVSDSGGFTLVKSGLGTLALTNSGNTFGGAGQTIDVLNGILAASSDGALGDSNNTITLEVDGTTGTGFRAIGSFSTARTFLLNAANNAIEVTAGNTLTLTTPFTLSATTNTLTKNDNGVLEIATANGTWNSTVTVGGGALRLSDSSALGTSTITTSGSGYPTIQLSGGVTISNPLNLTVAGGANGIDNMGVVYSVSGTNTYSGLITQASGVGANYGAAAGATLNINGNIAASNSAIFFAGTGGVVNLNSAYGNGGAGGPSFNKIGPGTLNVTSSQSAVTSAINVNAGTMTISGSGVKFGGTGAITIAPTATLAIDDTGTATANRLGGRPMTLQGGTLSYLGNAVTSTETLGVLTAARPGSTILADSNGGTSTITFASLTQNANSTLNFVSATAALGSANNKIIFTTAPTLTNSLLQRATLNGSDFVTYGANGIAPFTTYNAGSSTNINSVTATTGTADVTATMTTRNLTANRTINAMRLSDPAGVTIGATGAAFVAGGNTPAQLALSAGAILATGSTTHTISVPVLAMPIASGTTTVEAFYSVTSGTSLEIKSAITGNAGWVKNGPGTLTLTPPTSPIAGRGASTISGNATINDGTVILNGGNNTLAATNFLILGPTGTVDLNGNSQLARLMTDAAVENGGGIVTGSAASSTLVTLQDNVARNWAGQMTGALSFLRTGDNTLTMYSDNTYTGKTLLAGATTTLLDGARLSGTSDIEIVYATLNITNTGTKDLTDRIKDTAAISLRGGTINFAGRAQTASSETLGAVTLNKGLSFITSTAGGTGVNSADLTLTSLTQTPGTYATINFNTANLGQMGSFGRILIGTLNGVATDPTTVGLGLTNNIIGGWAEVQNDFATYIPGLGVAALGANGALQYDLINTFVGSTAVDNIRLTSTTTIPSGGKTVNAVSMTGSNIALNFTAGTDILNIVSGGLIGPNNNQTIGTTAIRGVLTAGGTASSGTNPLYIYNRANTLTVNSQIVDTATAIGSGTAKTALVLNASGGAITIGNGTNSYTGGTIVNGGTVNLNVTTGSVAIPLATNPADSLIINGGTVTMQNFAGQIDPAAIVTLNGNAVLNLFGANTLGGFIFRDDGGGTGGTGVNSNSGTLTVNGNIVSTTANVGSTSVLNGRYDFGATQRTLDISATRFNGQELAALLSDFNIQGITGSSGGFLKTGDGVLQFNAQANYTGITDVAQGRVQVGATNGGSRFSNLNLQSGTALNLNGLSTIWGSLTGTGFVFNSSASTTAQTLTVGFDQTDFTFGGTFMRFNDATPATTNLTKIGAGNMSLTAAGSSSTNLGVLTVNHGTVTYKDSGSRSFLTSATVVNEGGTLTLDNSNASSSANLNNRLNSTTGVTLNGGTFNLLGRDSTATTETVSGVLTLGPSASSINLTAGAGGTAVMTFTSLTQNAGSTAIVTGTNLGTDTKLLFTTAPTLVPATTGILARVAVGTDFATYNATNGVIAFTGYTTPTDINAAAATATIKIDGTTTVRDLTLPRTINAVNVIDNGVTVGSTGAYLLPTQGWTVTSGGVLVNGNSATISTPVLAMGAEGIFRVNGSALEVTSSITGTGGITKTGSGSMTLTGPQSYTGQTALNLGTLTLNGGKNTILVAPSGTIPTVADLQVNAGVFDLNGNNQAVRTILNSNTLSFIAGEITNSSATAATLTTAMNANSTFGGQISGNLSLVRSGNNTLTLSDAQTYTGATIIRGGGLQLLDNGSLATSSITLNFGALTLNNQNLNALANLNPVRIPATTPVTMTGGTFVVSPGGSVDNTMTLNTLTILAGGANTFTANGVNGGTNVINIGNLVLPTGAATTLHFNTDPGLATNGALPASGGAQVLLTKINGVTPTNNAFLGANVIINNGEYGVYNTVQGVIRYGGTAANGQTIPAYAAALASGNNLPNNISSTGGDVAISANTTIGALRLTGAATRAITFTAGTEVLNLALGGLLRDNNNNATNIGTTALRGVLTSGGTATTGTTDLVEFHNQNTLTINSVIADNGLGNKTRFVKSGPAGTTFTAANTYTGGTVVNSGTLTINATAGAGTIVIPAGGITLNNANLTMSTNQGQIDSSNAVTINGAGTLTLTGTNTLNSVTINGIGGSSTPTVAVGTLLTLSSATPITVTNDNYSFTPTISGTELNLVDGATISTAGESPDDLIISAKISTAASTTPLVKTGTGSLVLSSNTSAFSNGFNLDQGSLIFAQSSTGTPPAVTAGPVGTGTLTIGNGTAVMSDGTARTIGNAVSVTGDFTFGTLDAMNARANAGNNLTLSGTTTLAAGAHTITVNGLLMTGTISGQLTGGTDLTKDGPGTLVLSNATNNYGGATTVNAGTLQIGTAGSIPDASRLAVNTNGYFNLNGLAETVGSISGAGVITNTGAAQTLTFGGDSTTDGDFTGHITNQANALSLTMTGTGTQAISGVENSYTGVTTVNGGTLAVVKLADGGLVSSIGKSTNGATNLVINGGTLKYTGTGATDGTTDRQFTLGTSGGTIDASGAAGSALNFTSTSAVTLSGTNTARTLTLAGSNTDPNTIAASLGDNGTGATSLVKDGTGTWSVTANNGFSGGTTVNAGTLLVNNTPSLSTDSGTGTGIVTVNTGGTLGGNGTIAGDTTIGSGGILSPGSAAGANSGTLTFQAGLTVAGNGVAATQLAFNYTNATGNGGFTDPAGWAAYVATNTSGGVQTGLLAGTSGQSNDLVNLVATSGTPALVWGDGGKISLSQLGSTYTWMLGDVLNLIDWTTVYGSSIGGTFDASNAANWDLPSLGLGLSWDTTQFMSSGAIAVVPEPSRVLLLLLGLAGLFFRRRRR